MAKHWNRFPGEVVTAPSLPEFRKCLDNTPRHMVSILGSPAQGQESDSMILMNLFKVSIFYDSMVDSLSDKWLDVYKKSEGDTLGTADSTEQMDTPCHSTLCSAIKIGKSGGSEERMFRVMMFAFQVSANHDEAMLSRKAAKHEPAKGK
ncbi:hypothetical protein BTVI_67021 [Pitangus sulphuratus]|nr:hypothetical protein BTVI_67021 [Pitangus sulphuratus]